MTINELRLHLLNDCNKVTLECPLCKGCFRRPWLPYHDCRQTFLERLKEKDAKIQELEDRLIEKERQS